MHPLWHCQVVSLSRRLPRMTRLSLSLSFSLFLSLALGRFFSHGPSFSLSSCPSYSSCPFLPPSLPPFLSPPFPPFLFFPHLMVLCFPPSFLSLFPSAFYFSQTLIRTQSLTPALGVQFIRSAIERDRRSTVYVHCRYVQHLSCLLERVMCTQKSYAYLKESCVLKRAVDAHQSHCTEQSQIYYKELYALKKGMCTPKSHINAKNACTLKGHT